MPNRGNVQSAVCKHESYVYAGPFIHMLHLFIGLPARERGWLLGGGWVILGFLANRLWSPFGRNTKLLCGVKTSPDPSINLYILREAYHKIFCVFRDFLCIRDTGRRGKRPDKMSIIQGLDGQSLFWLFDWTLSVDQPLHIISSPAKSIKVIELCNTCTSQHNKVHRGRKVWS